MTIADPLDAALLEHALGAFAPIRVAHVAETGSTNRDLLAAGDPDATTRLLVADQQTAGRGRLQRTWHSEPGGALLVSVSRRFRCGIEGLRGLSLAVGVSLAESLRDRGVAVTLKWPNDLQVDGAKLGGILIELLPPGAAGCRVVIGFGINLRLGEAARAAIGQAATSLSAYGLASDRMSLLALLLDRLLADLVAFDASGFEPFRARFAALDALQGRVVRVGDSFCGRALGIDAGGRLLVGEAGDVRAFDAGEVSVRPE